MKEVESDRNDATTDEAMMRHLVLQPFEEVWSKLNKWIPRTGPLKDVEVASVSHFLREAGFARTMTTYIYQSAAYSLSARFLFLTQQ